MSRVSLEPKNINEIKKYVWDFASLLAVGETISSAVVVIAVYSGTDANPGVIASGAASISGTKVTQAIIGGLTGVTYLLTMQIATSTSQQLQLSGYLTILPVSAA